MNRIKSIFLKKTQIKEHKWIDDLEMNKQTKKNDEENEKKNL